jgi:hypothetical protein
MSQLHQNTRDVILFCESHFGPNLCNALHILTTDRCPVRVLIDAIVYWVRAGPICEYSTLCFSKIHS